MIKQPDDTQADVPQNSDSDTRNASSIAGDTQDELRAKLEKAYNESVMMGRLRTGSPMSHMIDEAMALIESQKEAWQREARIDENEKHILKINRSRRELPNNLLMPFYFHKRIKQLTKEGQVDG